MKKEIESDIEKYLIEKCKKEDIFCTKFISYGLNGVPDRLLIQNGYTYFIELKKPKSKTRALQNAVIKKMRSHGALIYCLDNKEGIDKILASFAKNIIPKQTNLI